MNQPARPWISSLAGIMLGAVALILVTAVLTGAVSSVRAEGKATKLSNQVTGLRTDNAALRDDNAALRNQVAALGTDNQVLRKQNRQMNLQLAALVKYLRAQGIAVPQTLAPQDSGWSPSPKDTGPRGPMPPRPSTSPTPASPAPTATPAPSPAPTPVPGIPDLCTVLAALCP